MTNFAQQIFYGLAIESFSLLLTYTYRKRPVIAILILVTGTVLTGLIAFIPVNNETPVRYALFAFVFVTIILLLVSNRFNFVDSPAIKSLAEKLNPSLRKRLRYLDEINDDSDADELQKASDDLVKFIKNLPHGDYCAKEIKKLTRLTSGISSYNYITGKGLDEYHKNLKRSHKEYRQQLVESRSQIYDLIDEFLKIQ